MDAMRTGIPGDGQDDTGETTTGRDFIQRYDDGPPHETISDDEVRTHFGAVAARLSPRELEACAAESYARLTPDERRQFAGMLEEHGGGTSGGGVSDDPGELARITTELHARNPGTLVSLIGSDGIGAPLTGGDEGAVGSQVRGQGGGVGELLQSPVIRAALGGIAAAAMRKTAG